MSGEFLDVYDANWNFLNRSIRRGQKLAENEFHLGVQIWVRNSNGEFLIQKRPMSLKVLPGIWATTAGAVEAGEDVLDGAVRELEEEVGIKVASDELQLIYKTKTTHFLGTVYLLKKDILLDELVLQTDEVSQVKWEVPSIILEMVNAGEFYDYGENYFEAVFSAGRK